MTPRSSFGTTDPLRAINAPSREVWVDTAKGIAIILVVLFHAIIFTNRVDLAWLWPIPAGILDTFRMPLFFLLAGALMACGVLSLMSRSGLWSGCRRG